MNNKDLLPLILKNCKDKDVSNWRYVHPKWTSICDKILFDRNKIKWKNKIKLTHKDFFKLCEWDEPTNSLYILDDDDDGFIAINCRTQKMLLRHPHPNDNWGCVEGFCSHYIYDFIKDEPTDHLYIF